MLEVLNRRQVTRVSTIVDTTGLPKASVVRILRVLESAAYVRRLPKRRGYSVDERVRALSSGYRTEEAVVTAARPILAAFTARYKWPLAIGTRDGLTIRVRDETILVSPFAATGDDSFVGRRIPMLISALGRAHLAFCPDDERREIVSGLTASTRDYDLPARDARYVSGLLASIRRKGYAVTEPNRNDQAFGLALPVRHEGRVLACVCLRYLGKSSSEAMVAQRYLEPMKDAVRAISAAMIAAGSVTLG
ncbi:MAG: helix-turn-helix domain-containing protein [Hyphomicrobiales bacterium]|nr:helix-turn-helix domain-containing protein [Hyphomicrobiales bacterium]